MFLEGELQRFLEYLDEEDRLAGETDPAALEALVEAYLEGYWAEIWRKVGRYRGLGIITQLAASRGRPTSDPTAGKKIARADQGIQTNRLDRPTC